tara:strand:- start:22128 stop:22781 length:654 start_codon:yes stop_codon:yes gene_type:complete
MKALTVVISDNNEKAVSEWNVRDWYLSLNDGDTAFVATPTMLSALQLGVRLKELETFTFTFHGQDITCGENGDLDQWPVGFMDQQAVYLKALIKGSTYDDEKASFAEMKKKRAQGNPFYTEKRSVERIYDYEKLKSHVNEYLCENTINYERFECTGVELSTSDCMEVSLKRVGEDLYNDGEIDEDFEDDEQWETFCAGMAAQLGVRIFGAPWHYYTR